MDHDISNVGRRSLVDICRSLFGKRPKIPCIACNLCKSGIKIVPDGQSSLLIAPIIEHACIHADIKTFQCRCCEYSSRTQSDVQTHIEGFHRMKPREVDFEDQSEKFHDDISNSIKRCFAECNDAAPTQDDAPKRDEGRAPERISMLAFDENVRDPSMIQPTAAASSNERQQPDVRKDITSIILERGNLNMVPYDTFRDIYGPKVGKPILQKINDNTFHLYFKVHGGMLPFNDYLYEMEDVLHSGGCTTSAIALFRAAADCTSGWYGITLRIFAKIVYQGPGKPPIVYLSAAMTIGKYFQRRGQFYSEENPSKYSYENNKGSIKCTIRISDIDEGTRGCVTGTLQQQWVKVRSTLIGMQRVYVETRYAATFGFGPKTSVVGRQYNIDYGTVPASRYIELVEAGRLPFCGRWWNSRVGA